MKSTFKLIVLFILFLLIPISAHAEDWSKVRSAIEQMNNRIEKAVIADDVELVLSFYAEDAISMPDYEPAIKGMDKLREHIMEERKAGFKYVTLDINLTDLIGSGDLAVETGEWTATFMLPGNPKKMTDNGKYLTVWEKQKDGSWKVKIETWNTNSFPVRDSENTEMTGY